MSADLDCQIQQVTKRMAQHRYAVAAHRARLRAKLGVHLHSPLGMLLLATAGAGLGYLLHGRMARHTPDATPIAVTPPPQAQESLHRHSRASFISSLATLLPAVVALANSLLALKTVHHATRDTCPPAQTSDK